MYQASVSPSTLFQKLEVCYAQTSSIYSEKVSPEYIHILKIHHENQLFYCPANNIKQSPEAVSFV